MDNETKNLIAIVVSAYAALISTITLVWNIINSVLSRISRFDVKVTFHDMIIGNANMQPIKGPRNMNISIVNKSNKNKYIQSINIKLPYKTDFGSYCGLYKDDVKFPLLVKPEEEIVLKYKLNAGSEWLFKNYRNKKCKFFIVDTTNKKYKSKKIKMNLLKNAYDFNCRIPNSTWNLLKNSNL